MGELEVEIGRGIGIELSGGEGVEVFMEVYINRVDGDVGAAKMIEE